MALLEVEAHDAQVLLALRNGERRMAYAVANALRTTILAVQSAERGRAQRIFHVRQREFLLRQAAIIKPFPSVAHLETRVAVGQKPRLLLPQFEAGGPRLPVRGRRMAVPLVGSPARPTFAQPVPESLTFKALALRRVSARGQQGKRRLRTDVTIIRRLTGSGAVQWKGTHRTFIINTSLRLPEGGVFQRVGPSENDIRLIYPFKLHVQPLRPILEYERTALPVALREFPIALAAEVRETVRFQLARAGGLA